MSIDRRKRGWQIHESFISLDGPDGSGKSVLAQFLAKELRQIFDNTSIIVVRPACFNLSPESSAIGAEFEKIAKDLKKHSGPHNLFFLRAMATNYVQVVCPLLEREYVVLCDSSEIRSLAFILDSGDKEAIDDTKIWIQSGLLTHFIQPGLRIILKGSDDTLWKNLKTKNTLDYGDPQNIEEVGKRIEAYKKAISFIKKCNPSRDMWWHEVEINHVPGNSQNYFADLVKNQLIPQIKKRIIESVDN